MLQIINYSEKAVAVIGDTKDRVNEFKKIGGRFNARLSCGAGWIFSKKVLNELQALADGGEIKPNEPKVSNALKGMRVYVGTYHKYNSGSIEGKWLNLADYANKPEFIKACIELHKDEPDPEFMFQDYEGIPSRMIGESFIDPEIWNLKPEPESGKQTNGQKRAYFEKCGYKGDIDYAVRNCALIVEVDGKCFEIPKQTIETNFCHPDEPEDEVRAFWKAVKTYEHFRNENMDGLDKLVQNLSKNECSGDMCGLFIYKSDYTGMWDYGMNADRYYLASDAQAQPMDEQTRRALLKGYKQVAKEFEKRLESWWKRYGYEKLHCWTYWRDA